VKKLLSPDERFIFDVDGVKYLIIHREALSVEDLIRLGKRLGVIDGGEES